MKISKSKPENHQILTKIAKSSKNFWKYPDEWMKLWEDDLTISEKYIDQNEVYQIEDENGKILGFYSYFYEDKNIRLEHLFINPNEIGKGIGKILMKDFLGRIKDENFENIILDADPNAENFYKKFGFKTVELKPTKIKDRFLPVMIKNLRPETLNLKPKSL